MRQRFGGGGRAARAGVLAACLGVLGLVACGGAPGSGTPAAPGTGGDPPAAGGTALPVGDYACEFLSYSSQYNPITGFWESIPYWLSVGTLRLGGGTYHWQGEFYPEGDGTFAAAETTGSDHFTHSLTFTGGPLAGRVLGGFEPGPLRDLLGEERPNGLLLAELGADGQTTGGSLNCFGPYES